MAGNPNQLDLGGMTIVCTDIVLASTPGGSQTSLSATEIAVLDGITAGTAAASKALVLNSSANLTAGLNNFAIGGTLAVTGVATFTVSPVFSAAITSATITTGTVTTLTSTTGTITTLGTTTLTPTTIAGAANFTGTPTFAAGITVTGAVTSSAQLRSTTATTMGTTGTLSLDPTLGQVFKITPTGTNTINAASAATGSRVYLVYTTSGTSSYTTTFGTNFKSTGTLATGTSDAKVFVIAFVGDGTNLNEISRTTAM